MAKKMVLVPASWLENFKDDKLINLLEMVPKSYQPKARILLTCLQGKVKLTDQQRVIYSDGVGSHIIDLVRYYVTPSQLKINRPEDAQKFGQLLEQHGVPSSAVNRPIRQLANAPNWMSFMK